jgi:hypothetical protein
VLLLIIVQGTGQSRLAVLLLVLLLLMAALLLVTGHTLL